MNQDAFLEQLQANAGIIYKLVGLYAADAEERKDLYQEVVLNAWKSWPRFRGDAAFSTWLYRLCLNTLLTLKRKPQMVDYHESIEDVGGQVQQAADRPTEESQRLWQAIRRLPETDRAIVSLHLDGYEHPEIADLLGISANHVAVKLYRSKQQLATLLNHTI